jgi:signal recognition particle GTPase
MAEQIAGSINPEEIATQLKIIEAMTEEERKNPEALLSKAFKVT